MNVIRELDTNFGEINMLKEESALLELIYNAWEEVQLQRSENFLVEVNNKNELVIINTSKQGNFITTDSFVIKSNLEKQNNNLTVGGNGWGLNAAISTLYKQHCEEIKIVSGKNFYEIKKGHKENTLSEVIYVNITEHDNILFDGTAINLKSTSEDLIKSAINYYFFSKIKNNFITHDNIQISNRSGTRIFAINNFVIGSDPHLLFSYNFLNDVNVDIRKIIGKNRPRKLAILEYRDTIREIVLSILNKSTNTELQAYIIKKLETTTLEKYYYELDSESNFSKIVQVIASNNPGLILTTKSELKLLENYLDEVEINNTVVLNENYEKYYTTLKSLNYKKGTSIISKNHKYNKDSTQTIQFLLDEELFTPLNEKENEVLNIYPCLLYEIGIKDIKYKIKIYENASNGISFEEIVKDDEKKEIKISRSILKDRLYFSKVFLPIAIKFLNINPSLKTEEYINTLCDAILERRLKVDKCLK